MIRARHEFEEFGKDRTRIIITELPYQVNKRQLIRNIAEQVKENAWKAFPTCAMRRTATACAW